MVKRPLPERGEYWHSKRHPTRIVCKAYLYPPSEHCDGLAPLYSYCQGEELGLIHDVDHSEKFVAVRVQDFQVARRLVWVNVWRATPGRDHGDSYAYRTEDAVVQGWRDRGWTDNYIY